MSRLPPNPALRQLEVLIGEWDVEVPQFPGQHGRARFDWLEGGAFCASTLTPLTPRRPPR